MPHDSKEKRPATAAKPEPSRDAEVREKQARVTGDRFRDALAHASKLGDREIDRALRRA